MSTTNDSLTPAQNIIEPDTIEHAERTAGLAFTPENRQMMIEGVTKNLAHYESLRSVPVANSVAPALHFAPVSMSPNQAGAFSRQELPYQRPETIRAPKALEEVAFWPVTHLAELLRTGQVQSQALTEMYLDRLERFGPQLECVITLTKERALEQARQADREIAVGTYRGPLHGIPWGAKDLLAVRGYPTTWGAAPYQEQVIDEDAAVVQRLDEAGAVLVAKLTMGALAWGDYWFGGRTRSPWNLDEGSSGSSAGSGAATAAGLVGFAIGTETHGSIVSPSTNCGLSGLRPTYGRVSRAGAMALCWSMDKIGPMCRSVTDCALVFNAIYGPDHADAPNGKASTDPTLVASPFTWTPDVDLSQLRIGYLAEDFAQEYPGSENDQRTLEVLRNLGASLIPISLPDYPVEALSIIVSTEAAAAFDELTRSGQDALLVRQVQHAWPNRFREARLIPAVEYIQANRVRTLIMQAMYELMQTVDLFVAPARAGQTLLLTNLTGHPAVVIPNGAGGTDATENGLPTSITLIGQLYDEGMPLAVASQVQNATDFHTATPPFALC